MTDQTERDPDTHRLPVGPAQPFVLLENSRDASGRSFLFEDPERIIACDDPGDLDAAFAAVEAALDDGRYLAGFLSYELGYALEPRLGPLLPQDRRVPLFWFGVFSRPTRLSRKGLEALWRDWAGARTGQLDAPTDRMSDSAYMDAVARIKDYLAAGDVYQINLTYERVAQLKGDPRALHAALRAAQPVGFGAYLSSPDFVISSHSPELFFRKSGRNIASRPMKGTAPRGRDNAEDDAQAAWLKGDDKSRAENLMIVDLIRNDLSRLAAPGSVRAEPLYTVERYLSVLQMTSSVSATLKDDVSLRDILEAIFPCGSITGAPKIRAMEIIRELEALPRGPYTGAIGYITPDRDACFSVPIRTLLADRDRVVHFGIGSGIVADSEAESERSECRLKARFLDAARPETTREEPTRGMPPGERPALIETIRWSPDEGFWLWPEHRQRLLASARWFNYPVDGTEADSALERLGRELSEQGDGKPSPEDGCGAMRVRLLAGAGGEISVTATPLEPKPRSPVRIAIASQQLDPDDPYLRHKTTRRGLYNRALAEARSQGFWDALFLNARGELAEGARSTLFLEKDGILLTPPLSAGVLPGVLRAHFFGDSPGRMEERNLFPGDFYAAEKIFLGNALYGLVAVNPVIGRIEI